MTAYTGNRLTLEKESKVDKLARVLEEGGEKLKDDAIGCLKPKYA